VVPAALIALVALVLVDPQPLIDPQFRFRPMRP
jgi:hypothetical protein